MSPNVPTVETLPPFVQWLFLWLEKQPILAGLLALMAIDTVCGILLSIVRKTLSSAVSWRGMSKKSIILLLVGVAAVLEPFAQGIPLSRIVGVFYIVTEAISILESAAAAGVPLPAALVDTLAKIKEAQRLQRSMPTSTQEVNLTIRPENMAMVIPERPREVAEPKPEEPDKGEGI